MVVAWLVVVPLPRLTHPGTQIEAFYLHFVSLCLFMCVQPFAFVRARTAGRSRGPARNNRSPKKNRFHHICFCSLSTLCFFSPTKNCALLFRGQYHRRNANTGDVLCEPGRSSLHHQLDEGWSVDRRIRHKYKRFPALFEHTINW